MTEERQFTSPPPLSPGDDVAVIAPSSGGAAFAPDVLDLGLRRLREEFDLNPVVYPTVEKDDEYLYDHPAERARDVHDAFENPDVQGVIATIGGDDQLRVLKHLDPERLRSNPTRFYGMSDNTNLASYLWNLGIVSFYGGQLMNQLATPGELPAYTKRYVERAFFEKTVGRIEPADEWTDESIEWTNPEYETTHPSFEPNDGWEWHRADEVVEGRVWGGCLEVLDWQLAAGQFLPDPESLDGHVLAIETSEDVPDADEVRWMLMCMGERGLLERFDAVLVGRPKTQHRFEQPSDEERDRYRRNQKETILQLLGEYNPDATVVFDLDFGHTNPTVPIPIGGQVRIDGPAREIAFL